MKDKRSMVVSLIGRPNVGKSSIFNRLLKRGNKALTLDIPGVTRDRHYDIMTMEDALNLAPRDIILVDTGGFYPEKIDEKETSAIPRFFNLMMEHGKQAIKESDLILFVVDAREGPTPYDKIIVDHLRMAKKEFWLVINKFDSGKQDGDELEFYSLGIGEEQMFKTSAEHALGLGSLREELHKKAHQFATTASSAHQLQVGVTPKEQVVGRVAIIGVPNAGKSTLLNQLVGSNRALVSDIPGTTVDPIEAYFDLYFGPGVASLEGAPALMGRDLLYREYSEFQRNNPEFIQEEEFYSNDKEDFEDMSQDDFVLQDEYQQDQEILESQESSQEQEEIYAQLFDGEDTQACEHEDAGPELAIDEVADTTEIDTTEIDTDDEVESIPAGSYWRSVHLVDTAGIRRQKSILEEIEAPSVYRSLRCITECDVVIYLIDISKGLSHQDRRLIDIALEKGKSLLIGLNKFDLIKKKLKTDKQRKEFIKDLRAEIPWIDYCELIPMSAKHGEGLGRLKKSLVKTFFIRRRRITTGELNRALTTLVDAHPISVQDASNGRFKVKYGAMIRSNPPTFLLFTNRSKGIPDNYRRYLKKGLRRQFRLDNTPVHIIFRSGLDLERRMKKVSSGATS